MFFFVFEEAVLNLFLKTIHIFDWKIVLNACVKYLKKTLVSVRERHGEDFFSNILSIWIKGDRSKILILSWCLLKRYSESLSYMCKATETNICWRYRCSFWRTFCFYILSIWENKNCLKLTILNLIKR